MPGYEKPSGAMPSIRLRAAKRRAEASSVASVASGYEHSLRPFIACFSLLRRTAT
jgi:hypothetical protein